MGNKLGERWWSKRRLAALGGAAGAVVFLNMSVTLAYSDRVYPLTQVYGMKIGGLGREELAGPMAKLQQGYRLEVRSEAGNEVYTAGQLGVNFLSEESLQSLTRHHWYELPMRRLWDRTPQWRPQINEARLAETTKAYVEPRNIGPIDAAVGFREGKFAVQPDKPGRRINEDETRRTLRQAVMRAAREVMVKSTAVSATITAREAESAAAAAEGIIKLELGLKYGDKRYTPAKDVVAGWLVIRAADDKKALVVRVEKARIAEYVATVARDINTAPVTRVVTVKDGVSTETTAGRNGRQLDQEQAVGALAEAIEKRQSRVADLKVTTVAFATTTSQAASASAVRTYRYCIALKGVSESHRAGFANEVARVYADSRGWSLGGKLSFVPAASGCAFTVWLSAASQVPSFSPSVCSTYYSCRVGANVIINYDRYMGAVSHWTLSLTDYRSMVINHETGHWLGFGHLFCGGAGQAAPVMQQQSISLQGCAANPWPTEAEKQTAARARGIVY